MLRSRFLAIAIAAVVLAGSSSRPAQAEAAKPPASAPVKVAAVEDGDTQSAPAVKKSAAAPSPTLTVKIDLGAQSMTVYENGSAMHSWPISSGTSSHPTPRGTFRPQWKAKMWYSRKYDNAPMPNAVFINGGVAIHGTSHVSRLGSPASHGCIRLAPGNAKAFYNLVEKHGMKRVRVSVYGTPTYRAPAYAKNRVQKRYVAEVPAAQPKSGNWQWLFGQPQYAPTSAYNPNFVKKQAKQKIYYSKSAKRYYVRAANGRKIYVRPSSKPKVYYYSSNY